MQFVIDGEQWIGDPFAAEQSDDGFGSRNAVLDVTAGGGTAVSGSRVARMTRVS